MGLFSSVTGSGTIVLIARILSDHNFTLPVLLWLESGCAPATGERRGSYRWRYQNWRTQCHGEVTIYTLHAPANPRASRGGAGHQCR